MKTTTNAVNIQLINKETCEYLKKLKVNFYKMSDFQRIYVTKYMPVLVTAPFVNKNKLTLNDFIQPQSFNDLSQ